MVRPTYTNEDLRTEAASVALATLPRNPRAALRARARRARCSSSKVPRGCICWVHAAMRAESRSGVHAPRGCGMVEFGVGVLTPDQEHREGA